jgi:hypothetical protein
MPYFIFNKDSYNVEGTIYRIAENQSDLNNINIIQSDYKIIQDSQENFNSVKLSNKYPLKYNNDNTITYKDSQENFTKQSLKNYIEMYKKNIKLFLDNNPNHPLFNQWNNYYNQLNNLDLESITYPLNKSLEQYFDDLGQTSLNPLQIP